MPMDFARLVPPSSPNWYLVAPQSFCKATVSRDSPVYNLPAITLAKKVTTIIEQLPRIQVRYADQKKYTYGYIQKSKWFRFPDFLSVQIIPLADDRSTLAIYSHAKYGYSDFGVNRKRVELILSALEKNSNLVSIKIRANRLVEK